MQQEVVSKGRTLELGVKQCGNLCCMLPLWETQMHLFCEQCWIFYSYSGFAAEVGICFGALFFGRFVVWLWPPFVYCFGTKEESHLWDSYKKGILKWSWMTSTKTVWRHLLSLWSARWQQFPLWWKGALKAVYNRRKTMFAYLHWLSWEGEDTVSSW